MLVEVHSTFCYNTNAMYRTIRNNEKRNRLHYTYMFVTVNSYACDSTLNLLQRTQLSKKEEKKTPRVNNKKPPKPKQVTPHIHVCYSELICL